MTLEKERQEAILKILHYIQNGGDFQTARKMFKDSFDKVDVSEITEAERTLIAQGLDPRDIQYLCNVHADVFKGNIEEKVESKAFKTPGHPVHTIKLENMVISSLIDDYLLPNLQEWEQTNNEKTLIKIQKALNDLETIDRHYTRKEVSIFPIMNKYGITAPPQVMWGVDDKIRSLIHASQKAAEIPVDKDKLHKLITEVSHEVLEMIFKEEKIMIPMIDEVASVEDWANVKSEESQIGYTLIAKPVNWKPELPQPTSSIINIDRLNSFFINFKEGSLNLEQLSAILDLLPFALTFVDENDKVVYFGGGAEIYPHSKNSIGNSVFECHSAKSRPIIKKIFHDFHAGTKDKIEYWFKPKKLGKMLYLRYYAVRDEANKYLGCLEVAEDITNIQKLTGEKKTM
ncbi:DUF438 domain-containing protein [Lactobacillus sp. PSON]|uniref:DUF438 domain-containing protein n=1 Tax=Lactobacillus sp. PSON TaxID=3455454 RepID=UPI00404245E1